MSNSARDVVDAHVHLFKRGFLPPAWFEWVARRWAASTWPPRNAADLDAEGGLVDDGDLLLREMDHAGVATAVCLSLDWGVELGEAAVGPREVHRFYAEMQERHPDRFAAVAGIDPRRPDAVSILDEAITDFGLHGLKLYPPTGFMPDDERCLVLYKRCLEHGVPVVFHTAFIGFPHIADYANPAYLGRVQAAFPELTIVLAHAGHPFWEKEAMHTAASHPSTYLEISNWNWELGRNQVQLARVLGEMIASVGAHRLLFATDHLGGRRFSGDRSQIGDWRRFIEALPDRKEEIGVEVTEADVDLILGENARRVFALSNGSKPNG